MTIHLSTVRVVLAADEVNEDDDDDEQEKEDSGVYRLQWFPESCSDGRTVKAPLVAMSATTRVRIMTTVLCLRY